MSAEGAVPVVRRYRPIDRDELLRMRAALWPHSDEDELRNAPSEAFHRAAGFEEVQRDICFRRDLRSGTQGSPATSSQR